MGYVALGAVAFVMAGFFDFASLKRIPYMKQSIGVTVVLLFGYSLVMVALYPVKLATPAWLSCAGWPFLVLGVFSLVYSLFLEIPFGRTYVTAGTGDELVKTGTYALVRHPCVLWLGLILLSLVLVTRSRLLLLATPVWLLADIAYVWIQEKFFLGRMFAGYEQYEKETPMLIPTRASIVRCWRTMPIRKGSRKRKEG